MNNSRNNSCPNGYDLHLTTIGKLVLFLWIASGCTSLPSDQDQNQKPNSQLFTPLASSVTGIDFQNSLVETQEANYYQYMYLYIGGGVAAADFNKDGREDLFFVSNSEENKLYLNQGNLSFIDYTEAAGIEHRAGFDAGVTAADVNHDGWMDIYISRGGWIEEDNRFANLLYINNGPHQENEGITGVTFTEMAEEVGLADLNRSISSTFFDYDNDGDLDVYVSNTPNFIDRASEVVDLEAIASNPNTLKQKGSDKLYNNDGNGHFTDVSESAGILPDLGFGLNPQVGDLNQDGWLDIYVCNDFRIPDAVYINNGNGTFKESREEYLKHMSFNSMGSDIADINNDGSVDIFTLDMNPEDYVRAKTTMGMTSLDRFQEMVDKGYHYNYMHNMLQINNGNGTFREIAQLAGVANTDWSWACLLADFDLDGYNDLYVTNGVFRDVIDRDANNAILDILRENGRKPTKEDFLTFTHMLPQQKLTNYFFKNKGDLTFENMSSEWTNPTPSFSNGAVYTDLDNDGDLDLVVNNINSEATILKNHATEKKQSHFLKLQFLGPDKNPYGIGTIARIQSADGTTQIRQLIQARGFLSSVSTTLHFGLGQKEVIPELNITWPDGKTQQILQITTNQTLTIDYKDAIPAKPSKDKPTKEPLFTELAGEYIHVDPSFNDYQKQILLPHKLSQTGPVATKADVNADGLEDLFIGGGHTQSGQLWIADGLGGFSERSVKDFIRDRQKEDVGACFFDVDNDNDMDLYVVSGSYEFEPNSRLLVDRLYINDGQGNFVKSRNLLPQIPVAGSVVAPMDYDQDGDIDLFVGGRVVPGAYPYAPISMLLVNQEGRFQLNTSSVAPELEQIGMVTDAIWEDLDNDGDHDLIITGEWMGIEVWINEQGQLARSEKYASLSAMKGWWNKLLIADIDQDGDKDIVAGNLGLNYKFHASPETPFHVYTNDYDLNGSVDVILAKNYKDSQVPVRGKVCATQQLPQLATEIPSFHDFASRDLEGILGPSIESALHLEAIEFRSGIFLNEGEGAFHFDPFSNEVQQQLINSIIYMDMDEDGIEDLLMAGNNYMSEVETTRADAGIGIFLKGKGKGSFEAIPALTSGFFADKDVRQLITLHTAKGPLVFVINNNAQHQVFQINNAPPLLSHVSSSKSNNEK